MGGLREKVLGESVYIKDIISTEVEENKNRILRAHFILDEPSDEDILFYHANGFQLISLDELLHYASEFCEMELPAYVPYKYILFGPMEALWDQVKQKNVANEVELDFVRRRRSIIRNTPRSSSEARSRSLTFNNYRSGGAIEPQVAFLRLGKDCVQFHSNTQEPHESREILRSFYPEASFVAVPIGGGFGSKQLTIIDVCCISLAKYAGRSVVLEVPGNELPMGPASQIGMISDSLGIHANFSYLSHRWLVEQDVIARNGIGPWRNPIGDMTIDEVAGRELTNCIRTCGALQIVAGLWLEYAHRAKESGEDPLKLALFELHPEAESRAGEVLRKALVAREEFEAIRNQLRRDAIQEYGVGVGFGWYETGMEQYDNQIRLTVDPSGAVLVETSFADIGQGLDMGGLAKIVCQHMGCLPETVTIRNNYDIALKGTAASLATSSFFEIVNDLTSQIDTGSKSPYQYLLEQARKTEEAVSLDLRKSTDRKHNINAMDWERVAYIATIVLTSVDKETGKTQVERAKTILDAGQILDSARVVGQVQGAVVQGIGETLMPDHSMSTTPSKFSYYHGLPRISDSPKQNSVELIDHSQGVPPVGVGEVGMISVVSAIIDSIESIGGNEVSELPLTPGYVLDLMMAGESKFYHPNERLHERLCHNAPRNLNTLLLVDSVLRNGRSELMRPLSLVAETPFREIQLTGRWNHEECEAALRFLAEHGLIVGLGVDKMQILVPIEKLDIVRQSIDENADVKICDEQSHEKITSITLSPLGYGNYVTIPGNHACKSDKEKLNLPSQSEKSRLSLVDAGSFLPLGLTESDHKHLMKEGRLLLEYPNTIGGTVRITSEITPLEKLRFYHRLASKLQEMDVTIGNFSGHGGFEFMMYPTNLWKTRLTQLEKYMQGNGIKTVFSYEQGDFQIEIVNAGGSQFGFLSKKDD